MQPQQPQRKFKSFADIDEHQLDLEAVHQPRLMLEKRDLLAHANKDVLEHKAALEAVEADAKAELKRLEADLQLSIRRNPAAFGLDGKTTEKMVDSTVLVHPRYVAAQGDAALKVRQAEQHLIDAKLKAELLDGQVEVCRQRKSMIEGLITLALSGHYANLRPPQNAEQQLHTSPFNKKGSQ